MRTNFSWLIGSATVTCAAAGSVVATLWLLGLGPTTTKALIRSGELRSIKIGRARRVPDDALREYVRRLDREQNGVDVAQLSA